MRKFRITIQEQTDKLRWEYLEAHHILEAVALIPSQSWNTDYHFVVAVQEVWNV
jgi:hypothetical protein